jgi:hypothetical protein
MSAHGGEETFVEPRWPIALAIAVYLALMITLRIYEPYRPALGTRWLVPAVLGGLLVALVLADPARIEGHARWLRKLSGVLILALAAMALAATALLIADLIRGSHVTAIDYLILGLTTSTAFSPTDVMPIAPWAKLTMALQSIISLAVVGLVIARAVNVFS